MIEKLGGVEAVSRITGKHVSRVYRWMYPKTRGGTGGLVPHSDASKLLNHASAAGIALAAADFFPPPVSPERAEELRRGIG